LIVAYSESHDVHVGCDYIYLYIDRSKKGNTQNSQYSTRIQYNKYLYLYLYLFIIFIYNLYIITVYLFI